MGLSLLSPSPAASQFFSHQVTDPSPPFLGSALISKKTPQQFLQAQQRFRPWGADPAGPSRLGCGGCHQTWPCCHRPLLQPHLTVFVEQFFCLLSECRALALPWITSWPLITSSRLERRQAAKRKIPELGMGFVAWLCWAWIRPLTDPCVWICLCTHRALLHTLQMDLLVHMWIHPCTSGPAHAHVDPSMHTWICP